MSLFAVLLYVALLVLGAFAGAVLAARWAADRGRHPAPWAVAAVSGGALVVAAHVYWLRGDPETDFSTVSFQLLLPLFAMFGAAAVVHQLPAVIPRLGPGPHPVRWLEADLDAELTIEDSRIRIEPVGGEAVEIEAADLAWIELDGEAVALRAGGETRRLVPRGIARREPRIRVAEGLIARIEAGR